MREKEREGSTKSKGGLNKKLQIPTLPPKHPRSGVTFHLHLILNEPIFRSSQLNGILPIRIASLLHTDAPNKQYFITANSKRFSETC